MNEDRIWMAWAAGIFEGEGCISIRWRKGVPYVQLLMGMTDRDTVEKFLAAVGCGHIRVRNNRPPRQPLHLWYCGRKSEVERLAVEFAPFLSARRLAKLDEAMTAWGNA